MGPKTSPILDGFRLGLIFGALLGATLPFLLLVGLHFKQLHEWQELIGGILALLGAGGAVYAVMKQIAQAQGMEDERRERREYAARAMMSHALKSVCQYANGCCLALRNLLNDHNEVDPPDTVQLPDDWNIPSLSGLSITPLQQLLEFGDRKTQRRISELIQELQIQRSRIEARSLGYQGGAINKDWYYLLIFDSLKLYARASMLFAYARGQAPDVPDNLKRDDLLRAAQNCDFDSPRWNELITFLREDWSPS